jgi:type III secretion system FlhB-like substrate exporter
MTAALNPMPAADLAKASLDRLDAVASVMERKWGIDRLPKLVDAPLAVRFRSQAERLDEAIRSDASAAVSAQAEAMLRAWNALDAAAITGGWKPLAPTIWETVLPETGEVIVELLEHGVPVLLAKGTDEVAMRIREIAEKHKIPIMRNPPLARVLYATTEIEEEIPVEHYQAVAKIIGYVYKLKGKTPEKPATKPPPPTLNMRK